MNSPELYIRNNYLQRRDNKDTLNRFIDKMIWKPNEIVLDIGCGPGDVTSDILFNFLKDKINQLVGVDKSKQMIEYAINNYGYTNNKIHFKVMDIENTNDFKPYLCNFNKLFSFFCFHRVQRKYEALINMHTMLKTGGEILVEFILVNPFLDLYKCLDTELQKYIEKVSTVVHSQEDIETVFIKAGFRIILIESNLKKYTFPDLSTLLDHIRSVDDMYYVIPSHLHDKYTNNLKEIILRSQMFDVCSTTGKATELYTSIIVHAIKD